jgi:hypothetical protein
MTSSFVSRWPIWYLLVVLYCLYLGFEAFRFYQRSQPGLATAAARASTPKERGRITGYRARLLSAVVGWPLAALGLLTGTFWIQGVVAAAFVVTARSVFRDYTTGFAEGMKASQLASSVEYVQGRVRPTRAAFAAAAVFTMVTRIVPAGALVYAMRAV